MVGTRWHISTRAVGCADGPAPGTVALQVAALDAYGSAGAVSAGIFNCRKIAPGGSWSIHAEGRALDLAVREGGQGLGDLILLDLRANAWDLGLQRVIWWRKIYDLESPDGRDYSGPSPHTDHLHIEQTREAAATLSVVLARSLLGSYVKEPDGESMVILRRLADHEDAQRWLLAAGRRIVLNNWANVESLMVAGVPTVALTDAQLGAFPQVG